VRDPQCHAIEQVPRRWREDDDPAVAVTRHDNLIHAQAVRTTFRFSAADGIDLSTERDVLFVALDEQKRERALVEEATVPPSSKWFAFGGAPQKKRTFAVSVPEGAGPGSRLRVRAPTTGQDMTVTVPAGVGAGGLFDVPLPEPRLPSLGE
jgi:hypothetical protein